MLTIKQQEIANNLFPEGKEAVKDRWRKLWTMATPEQLHDGRVWYGVAFNNAMYENGIVVDNVNHMDRLCAATAHLSPKLAWARNIEALKALVESNGTVRPNWVMSGPWDRAVKAYNSSLPWETFSETALKTYNFGRSLAGYPDTCVIDTHMIHAAMSTQPSYNELSSSEFRAAVKFLMPILVELAEELGAHTTHVQATIWLVHKIEKFN